jgi:hypothetical protein
MALTFEALGRCVQLGPRRNLAATTTSSGGSSHDQLPSCSDRYNNCDPDHVSQLGGGPGDGAPIDPDPPVATRKIIFPDSSLRCPLLRIDRQLVRCDNLTGAGVPAPLFIPEL